MFGFLNLHKPPGCTSRDVVNRVVRCVRPFKAGHAGTLDPLARGVLVVAVGQATRLMTRVHEFSKTYRAEFELGQHSPTEDLEGTVTAVTIPASATSNALRELLPRWTGTIQQCPPAYSAVQVAGERAYRAARRGETVELAPRSVEVHRLTLLEADFPRFRLEIDCGTGVYVRSLGRDLARSLGTEAVMTDLVRTRVGPWRLEDALDVSELSRATVAAQLQPPDLAFPGVQRMTLMEGVLQQFVRGQPVLIEGAAVGDGEVRLGGDEQGRLRAVVESQGGLWRPRMVFPLAENAAGQL